jgi:hypothetical protein
LRIYLIRTSPAPAPNRAQQTIVKDEIDEEVILVEGEALLAGLKEKALAEF